MDNWREAECSKGVGKVKVVVVVVVVVGEGPF